MDDERKLVFISHANPEENEFARWLGLQLTREGYEVWSDVTKLIGGESFWANIEGAIRNHTAKFLFVLSKASNTKQGTLDELHLARTISNSLQGRDFIVPLRVDDLPFQDANVAIHRLKIIDFTHSWADGLASVLKKLQEDGVPRDASRFNPTAVSAWWRSYCEGADIVQNQPEMYLSNWFAVEGLPTTVYIHSCGSPLTAPVISCFPMFETGGYVISFATATDLGITGATTIDVPTIDFLDRPLANIPVDDKIAKNAVTKILRQAWDAVVRTSGLPTHTFSGDRVCAYFTDAILQGQKLVGFDIPGCKSGRRGLVGHDKGRVWHFAVSTEVRLFPSLVYCVYPHVVFSDDGTTIWSSDARMHRARRSVCKDWWNQHWRDRILATMFWLAQRCGGGGIALPLASAATTRLSISPLTFTSPVSYGEQSVVEGVLEADEDVVGLDDAAPDEPGGAPNA